MNRQSQLVRLCRFAFIMLPRSHRLCQPDKILAIIPYGYQLTTTKESNDRYIDVAPEFMEAM